MDVINLGKHYSRVPHVLVAVMGIFKGEDCNRMHLLPFVNLTLSGIRIHMFLYRLIALLKE